MQIQAAINVGLKYRSFYMLSPMALWALDRMFPMILKLLQLVKRMFTQMMHSLKVNMHTKSQSLKRAGVDTGVDLDHSDLTAKLMPGYDFVDKDELPDDEQW